MLKPEQSAQQQPMAPMPFYADPNRFSAPVWQADPTQGWPQGQFIQQIPAASQPTLEGYQQQYSNGIYQTTYQQPGGFESNTFYAGAVQVLTRPPSASNQTQLASRPNGSYSHTPSPVSAQPQQNNQRSNISGQYQQEYATNNQNYVAPATTPTGNVDSSQSGAMSRPSSVNSTVNVPTNNQNFQSQHAGNFTPISSSNFSPVSNSASSFVNSSMTTSSGNAMPGYPPVSSHPQLASHNYSGGYPGNEMSGQGNPIGSPHSEGNQHWQTNADGTMWDQNVIQQTCNNESAKSDQSEMQQYTQNSSSAQQNHLHIKNDQMQYTQQSENKSNEQQMSLSQAQNSTEPQFSQADRVNLNSRLKTMILNKQQQQLENKVEDAQKIEQNKTGHFLSYSHHRHPISLGDGGGFKSNQHPHVTSSKNYKNGINWKITAENMQKYYNFVNHKFSYTNGFNKTNKLDNLKYEIQKNSLENKIANSTITPSLITSSLPQRLLTEQKHTIVSSNVKSYSKTEDTFLNNKNDDKQNTFYKNSYNKEKILREELLQKEHNLADVKDKNQLYKHSNLVSPNKYKENETARMFEHLNKLNTNSKSINTLNQPQDTEKYKSAVGFEIPPCECLPPHQFTPEPGSYYTHLGCANSLASLRKDLEERTGVNGRALRIEKVYYTGKEGKSPQGCPIAKWIIRRENYEEKYLIIVKQRPGHHCYAAVIVVCIVAWDGVNGGDADIIYEMLCDKLNKFGVPTNRRCATNEPRTCACQGLDPEKCGASFSFGCSWSMYYNGCKYARSKIVRKFRLSVKSEEEEVEERLQSLATNLSPLYKVLAPESFKNQCQYEQTASDCRLGLQPGRPFSGVTACLDFCAHAHKDSHNMNNGCTVVVTLTKHRGMDKPEDEQLHVLPLYVIDDTDEFGSREEQEKKIINGSIEVLHRYKCEVRVRNVPQPTCRRNAKKRKEESQEKSKNGTTKKEHFVASPPGSTTSNHESPQLKTPTKQLQSNHVSSTVLDRSPWGYENNLYYNPTLNQQNSMVNGQSSLHSSALNGSYNNNKYQKVQYCYDGEFMETMKNYPSNKIYSDSVNSSYNTVLLQEQPDTALNLTYPHSHKNTVTHTITANTSTLPFYKNFDHRSISTNSLQIEQNASLNYVNATANEYKYSNLYETPLLTPGTSKGCYDSNSLYNNSTRKNLYHQFSDSIPQNVISNNMFQNHNNLGRSDVLNSLPVPPQNGLNFPKKELLSPTENLPLPSKINLTNQNLLHSNFTKTQNLPSFQYIKNSKNFQNSHSDFNYNLHSTPIKLNSPHVHVQNPFDDSHIYGTRNFKQNDFYQQDYYNYDYDNVSNWCSSPPNWFSPSSLTPNWYQTPFGGSPPEPCKTKVLGQVTDVIDNSECFNDSQVGGVAIALSHGSVLFECAKHELHATTALKNPDRKSPTRISLVFYQHRNLNKSKHGWEEHEEKMRLRKLDSANIGTNSNIRNLEFSSEIPVTLPKNVIDKQQMILRVPTMTTVSLTTVFPMHPCMVTGPYQEGVKGA